MMQDKTFEHKYTDLIYGATDLMRACCDHFVGHPNKTKPYKLPATCLMAGKVVNIDIKATFKEWEEWSELIHINNVANCSEMLVSGLYGEKEQRRIFEHKNTSLHILASRMDNSMNHLVKVPEAAKSFLLQFCENKNIIS